MVVVLWNWSNCHHLQPSVFKCLSNILVSKVWFSFWMLHAVELPKLVLWVVEWSSTSFNQATADPMESSGRLRCYSSRTLRQNGQWPRWRYCCSKSSVWNSWGWKRRSRVENKQNNPKDAPKTNMLHNLFLRKVKAIICFLQNYPITNNNKQNPRNLCQQTGTNFYVSAVATHNEHKSIKIWSCHKITSLENLTFKKIYSTFYWCSSVSHAMFIWRSRWLAQGQEKRTEVGSEHFICLCVRQVTCVYDLGGIVKWRSNNNQSTEKWHSRHGKVTPNCVDKWHLRCCKGTLKVLRSDTWGVAKEHLWHWEVTLEVLPKNTQGIE